MRTIAEISRDRRTTPTTNSRISGSPSLQADRHSNATRTRWLGSSLPETCTVQVLSNAQIKVRNINTSNSVATLSVDRYNKKVTKASQAISLTILDQGLALSTNSKTDRRAKEHGLFSIRNQLWSTSSLSANQTYLLVTSTSSCVSGRLNCLKTRLRCRQRRSR